MTEIITQADAMQLVGAAVASIQANPGSEHAVLAGLLPVIDGAAADEAFWRDSTGIPDRPDWPTVLGALVRAILRLPPV